MAENYDSMFDTLLTGGPVQASAPEGTGPPSPVAPDSTVKDVAGLSFMSANPIAAVANAVRGDTPADFFKSISDLNPFTAQDFSEMAGETATTVGASKLLQKVPNPYIRAGAMAVATVAGNVGGQVVYKAATEEELDPMAILSKGAEAGAWSLGADTVFGVGGRIINKIRRGAPVNDADLEGLRQINDELANSRVKIVPSGGGYEVRSFGPEETIPDNAIDVTLRPDQIQHGGLESLKAKVGKVALRGEAKFQAIIDAQNQAFQDIWEQNIQLFGSEKLLDFGLMVKTTNEAVKEQTAKITEPLFKEVDQLAATTIIDMAPVYSTAADKLSKAGANVRSNFTQLKDGTYVYKGADGKAHKLDTNLPTEIEAVNKLLANKVSGNVPFSEAMQDIKTITSLIDQLPKGSGVRRELEGVRDSVYNHLDSQAKKAGSDVFDKWSTARELYRNGMEGIYKKGYYGGDSGSDILIRALDTHPHEVADYIIKTGGEVGVRGLKNFLLNAQEHLDMLNKHNLYEGLPPVPTKEITDQFKAIYLAHTWNDLATRSGEVGSTVLATLGKAIAPKGTVGHDPNLHGIVSEVFDSPEELARFRRLVGMGAKLEDVMAGNLSLMIRGQQSAGIRGAASDVVSIAQGDQVAVSTISATLNVMRAILPDKMADGAFSGDRSRSLLSAMSGLKESVKTGKWGAQDWTRLSVLLAGKLSDEQEQMINEAYNFSGELPPWQAAELRGVFEKEYEGTSTLNVSP